VTQTPGQRQALRQVRAVAQASAEALELLTVLEPSDEARYLGMEVSVDCRSFEHCTDGLLLRERERLLILVPQDFPFRKPELYAPHRRWAGTPHVQWGNSICLYQAPTVEWIPSDGMYGFLDRVELWLRQAAKAELDPAGAPLHPPVAYVTTGAPLVIPRADTPTVLDKPWLGWASMQTHGERRIDLTDWTPLRHPDGQRAAPPHSAGAAFLLPSPMDWEYPEHTVVLLMALVKRGVDYSELMLHLKLTALNIEPGQPMLVVVGSAMRGIAGQTPRQHLAVWRIPGDAVDQMRLALAEYLDDEEARKVGKAADERAFEWLRDSKAEWCPVREARPEVIVRRDAGSPMEVFAGKRITVWGCGALGAPIAHWLARAGVAALTVIDSASVAPGVIVRQPYQDADIGRPKAEVLAEQLRAIRPDIIVTPLVRDIRRILDEADWHSNAEILIDCSANLTVQTKLERVRRERPLDQLVIATLLVGHTAEHGLAVLARPEHSGASADVLRAVKLNCLQRLELGGFADEFWPRSPRTDFFQPEPGCSDATFRGSGAEASALAGALLCELARDLQEPTPPSSAAGHLMVLAGGEHQGARNARLTIDAATRMTTGAGEYEIRLSASAVRELRSWITTAARRLGASSETGGLIFGQRDEAAGVIWVDRLSGPPPDSKQSPVEFVCGTEGVEDLRNANRKLGRGSLEFLGMWHTHPGQSSDFSPRDLLGMAQLLAAAPSPLPQGLILIIGHARAVIEPNATAVPDVSAYVFDGTVGVSSIEMSITEAEPAPLAGRQTGLQDVGLALSGGGARAIAFHLGCLRALYDRGILDRVRVISGVSGGSVIAALYAYFSEDFRHFDERVRALLGEGLQLKIARRALLSHRLVQSLTTRLVAGTTAGAARTGSYLGGKFGSDRVIDPPLRRWVSRTDAFADVLSRQHFGDTRISEIARPDLDVIINACDLTTGSAFRFGSRESGTWRIGKLVDNDVAIAEAVAASAAYPLLLPALDRRWRFEKDGIASEQRVVLTDGGVFDNLGTTCLEPGRSERFSTNVYDVDYILACDAGRGLLDPEIPFGAVSRMSRSFTATFRKAQDATRARLHALVEHGQLKGFAMPYLGQSDSSLPYVPTNLVRREDVVAYPTDFSAMSPKTIAALADRGEQLTRLLIERWTPDL
jgi:predicted acylesterase/phospholipase RssA